MYGRGRKCPLAPDGVAFIDARFGVAVFSIHAVCRRLAFAPTPVLIAFQLLSIIPCDNSSILEKLLMYELYKAPEDALRGARCGVQERTARCPSMRRVERFE